MRERSPNTGKAQERLDIYKMAVEMADRVSQRRQSANSFYLSINSILVAGSAYLGAASPAALNLLVVAVAGIAICMLWLRNIWSYKTLNDAKFKVIHDLETRLPEKPYAAEWAELDPDGDGQRHVPFHKVERIVPWVFVAVYVVQSVLLIPWLRLVSALTKMVAC